MDSNEFYLESFDQFRLSVKCFSVEAPKAVIQVIHGMSEHKERYEPLAQVLVQHGFGVVLSDLRGHGGSVWPDGTRGYFGADGIETLIRDQYAINQWIREQYSGSPVYQFAHSMGSLIARNYIQKHDDTIDKLILSGAPCYQKGSGFACALCKLIISCTDAKGHNKLIKSFAPGGSENGVPNAWISYNKENVEAYNRDEQCGFPFTNAGYLTLYDLDRQLHQYQKYAVQNPELPILFLAGKDDCVIGCEKGMRDSVRTLERVGYRHVQAKIYEGMRHEILNEDEGRQVMEDAAAFYAE